jgi:replicative DNA helicase
VVGPNQESDNVASLKIVPFAIARRDLDRALEIAGARPGILEVRPFQPGRRVAMIFVAEPAAQERTRDEYLPPTQTRLQALGGEIVATEMVDMEQTAIAGAAGRLAQQADLLIIAGRPGMGKTGFMLSVAKNAAQKHKKHVAMFSLEMSSEQLVQRLISQETGIDSQRLRSGKLKDEEWPLFTHAIEVLGDTQIWLDDTPGITPMALRTKCRRLHMEYQLDLVIVDYLQLMSGDLRTENRVQEVSYISRNLKTLARELNVPVLVGAQLSRAVEQRADKRPVLSDLRESGSLEQDADIVMFIHRPDAMDVDVEKKNKAEIIVAKHRNGPTHPGIQLVFLNNLARFDNAARTPKTDGSQKR